MNIISFYRYAKVNNFLIHIFYFQFVEKLFILLTNNNNTDYIYKLILYILTLKNEPKIKNFRLFPRAKAFFDFGRCKCDSALHRTNSQSVKRLFE